MTDELRDLAVLWARVLVEHHGADMLTIERFAAVLVDRARGVKGTREGVDKPMNPYRIMRAVP